MKRKIDESKLTSVQMEKGKGSVNFYFSTYMDSFSRFCEPFAEFHGDCWCCELMYEDGKVDWDVSDGLRNSMLCVAPLCPEEGVVTFDMKDGLIEKESIKEQSLENNHTKCR